MGYQLKLKKGSLELEQEVLKQNLCTVCGACLSLCPYFRVHKEKVVLLEPCGLAEGRCYEICPRVELDFDELNQSVFGKERDDYLLGTNQGLFLAQSKDEQIQKQGQYGGVVSGILIYALEQGIIDGAIVTGYSSRYQLLPEPYLAKTKEEVLACAGSKYTSAPSLMILDKALRECDKLAFVGRACQIEALRKRIQIEPEVGKKIALIIGLFCMWALDWRALFAYLSQKIDINKAKKFDIPYNQFLVYTEKEKIELDFQPIRQFRKSTCDICYDFTAELADLSVGSTEWKDDWNTLIIRSERAKKIIQEAENKGALKLEPFPKERENLLRDASLGKKKRVISALFEEKKAKQYLKISDKEKQWIKQAKPVSGVEK